MLPTIRRLPGWLLPAVLAVVLVGLPQLGLDLSTQRQIELTCILALLVSGLNLSLGYAGELALGQAAVYAVGAYLSGYLGTHGHTDILLQLLASAAAALVVGLITGIPGLRLGSWSLAMTSFFLVLLVPDLIAMFPDQTGGRIGLVGLGFPTLFGRELAGPDYYLFVTAVTVLWFLVLRNLVTSRHGAAFRVLRQSPVLAASTGISVYRLKLTAYAMGSVPAGVAGTLFANLDHYISPTAFDFSLAVSILAASILGGSASVYGALVGAAIMQFGPMESTSFQKYALVVYGAFLIIGGVLLAEGLAGIMRRLGRRGTQLLRRRQPGDQRAQREPGAQQEAPLGQPGDQRAQREPGAQREAPVPRPGEQREQREPGEASVSRGAGAVDAIGGAELAVHGISKRFSGLQALRDVSLSAVPGQVTALIGPNGSGKTTLLNVIGGFYGADAGSITVGGREPGRRPHLVARAGVARTFQTPIVPAGLSVLEAVAVGRYMMPYRSLVSAVLRLPGYRRVRAADLREARHALELVGIADLADADAAALPLGTRRLLEVACALVAHPKLLLLDEAASGLDEAEIDTLAGLIRRIRYAGGTVLLVEHNFRLVLSLADHIHVLAQGQVIASGPPAEIEHHPAVLREYLGVQPDERISDLAALQAEVR
ncbi:MAG TPA: branched-chain amino acid ABC transporter ATP-binding protein/permease [Mycobacteriales bacterium]|nr:branched-chain amino acid ABC transporter ATP-binding protein/permease [Mycobacteriales bacterium]